MVSRDAERDIRLGVQAKVLAVKEAWHFSASEPLMMPAWLSATAAKRSASGWQVRDNSSVGMQSLAEMGWMNAAEFAAISSQAGLDVAQRTCKRE